MNPSDWEKVKELLQRYLEQPVEEREEFLRSAADGDATIIDEVHGLSGSISEGFLDPPLLPGENRGDWLDPSDLPAGTRVDEYEVVRMLGGGMGVVYLARQESLKRDVALKVLPVGAFFDDARVSRFELEALAAARLQHPNIVHVFAAGKAQGLRFIAMEYVDGADLGQVLDFQQREDPSPLGDLLPRPAESGRARRIAAVVRDVAGAVEYAHQHGILHRDIKPQNILLDRESRPYLADFGLAKDVRGESISVAGQILGTPYYMSPEQALAKRVPVDQRSDVFSLGAVLYECLTLRRPFEGDSFEHVLQAITFSDPIAPRKHDPRIHRDLETVCLKALEKSPERRFASMAAFSRELDRFLANEPLTIRRTLPAVRLARRLVRNRAAAALAALVLLLLACLPVVFRRVRAAEVGGALTVAEAAAASAEETPVDELRRVLDVVAELRTRASTEQLHRIDEVVARIRTEGERLKAAGLAARQRGLAQSASEPWETVDRTLDEALALFWRARLLLPEDAELIDLTDVRRSLPTLTLTDMPEGLRVRLRPIDRQTGLPGRPVELGTTPLTRHPVSRGFYRIVVGDGQRSCELTRMVEQRGREYRLRPRLLPEDEVTADMVRIEPADVELELHDRGRVAVRLEGYWIDRTEVSIGSYRRFLRETGYPPPEAWLVERSRDVFERVLAPSPPGQPEKRTEWDDHPIGGVTLDDARAYAEWCGKRLPTVFEWDHAARGPALLPYPWTDRADLDDEEVHAHAAVLDRTRASAPDRLRDYLARTVPVTSMPQGQGPFGLLHAYGNVKEWVDTPHVSLRRAGTPATFRRADAGTYLVRGNGWDTPPSLGTGLPLDLDLFDKKLAGSTNLSVGFRCAKTLSESP